jgi:hypothetical protein
MLVISHHICGWPTLPTSWNLEVQVHDARAAAHASEAGNLCIIDKPKSRRITAGLSRCSRSLPPAKNTLEPCFQNELFL